ncbi:MAG: hypothetical protein E6K43_01845 [Gammaproteobacteria bacterium]|nr:MAG: hypothetical protein E6K43_01845 [Gammaproteobacteria bacterium]
MPRRSEFGIAYRIPATGSSTGVGDEVCVQLERQFSGPPLAATGAQASCSAALNVKSGPRQAWPHPRCLLGDDVLLHDARGAEHEDHGMMSIIEVRPPSVPGTAAE